MPSPPHASHWYLWAKSPKPGQRALYHPLLYHLIDVAMVARSLWQTAMAPTLRLRITRALNLPDEEAARDWMAFLAGLHDIGKGAPGFVQGKRKWEGGLRQILAAGFEPPKPNVETPHGFTTAAALIRLLPRFGLESELATPAARVVAGHHGVFPSSQDFVRLVAPLGGPRWAEARSEVASSLWRACELDGKPVPSVDLEREPGLLMVLAGLTSVADWIGSDETYFPYAAPGLDPLQYAHDVQDKAERALAENGWKWRGNPGPLTFQRMFPFPPNELQKAAITLADTLTTPALVLIESPTGGGKTEAALYIADRLAQVQGQHGCYFALPTQATSNQMFSRMRKFLAARYPEETVAIQLLHGHSALSAEFEAARRDADRLLSPTGIEGEEGYDQAPSNVVAAEWFTGRKRGLLTPFGVGTVDQALLSVLQTRHFFVRLYGLAGKVVVIDEVHAYDAYMSQLLERLLEWLAHLGCSVILLSATLPAGRRRHLIDAFAEGAGTKTQIQSNESSYPRLTWVSPSGHQEQPLKLEDGPTVYIRWVDRQLPEVDGGPICLGEALQEALGDRGCAAVICNTVGMAQQVYRALQRYFPPHELGLFHARYLFEDRAAREARTVLQFGPPGACERPRRFVLVATQVIEQSLDLDFDLLVTETAPVDLVLQRVGRLHRHRRVDRPPHLATPTLWVIKPETDRSGAPRFRQRVYDRHVLLRSWLALQKRSMIQIPVDVEPMVEEVYGPGEPPPELVRVWEASKRKQLASQAKAERIAESLRIAKPDPEGDLLARFNQQLEEENPTVHSELQALTRLSDRTVALVVLFDTSAGPSLAPDGSLTVDVSVLPDRPMTLRLLARSLTVSYSGVVTNLINQPSPEGWKRSPWLRHHRLLLVNPALAANVGLWQLKIDPDLGLLIRRGGKESDE